MGSGYSRMNEGKGERAMKGGSWCFTICRAFHWHRLVCLWLKELLGVEAGNAFGVAATALFSVCKEKCLESARLMDGICADGFLPTYLPTYLPTLLYITIEFT